MDSEIEARVHPVFLPKESFLAKVNSVYNAVLIDGDLTGNVTFIGKGAGPLPTSSAVAADIVAIAHSIYYGQIDSHWYPVGNQTCKVNV